MAGCFYKEPYRVLFGAYFAPEFQDKVRAIMEVEDRDEFYDMRCKAHTAVEHEVRPWNILILANVLCKELGEGWNRRRIFLPRAHQVVWPVDEQELAEKVQRATAVLANCLPDSQERLYGIALQLSIILAVHEQGDYERPSPITGLSRADMEYCVAFI